MLHVITSTRNILVYFLIKSNQETLWDWIRCSDAYICMRWWTVPVVNHKVLPHLLGFLGLIVDQFIERFIMVHLKISQISFWLRQSAMPHARSSTQNPVWSAFRQGHSFSWTCCAWVLKQLIPSYQGSTSSSDGRLSTKGRAARRALLVLFWVVDASMEKVHRTTMQLL